TEAAREALQAKENLEKATAAEIRSTNERERNERLAGIADELTKIKQYEAERIGAHEEGARKRREITLREIEAEIAAEQQLANNPDVGSKAQEEALKRISDLKRKFAEEDAKTQKEIEAAITKDAQENIAARISEVKREVAEFKAAREKEAQ